MGVSGEGEGAYEFGGEYDGMERATVVPTMLRRQQGMSLRRPADGRTNEGQSTPSLLTVPAPTPSASFQPAGVEGSPEKTHIPVVYVIDQIRVCGSWRRMTDGRFTPSLRALRSDLHIHTNTHTHESHSSISNAHPFPLSSPAPDRNPVMDIWEPLEMRILAQGVRSSVRLHLPSERAGFDSSAAASASAGPG